MVRDFGIMFFQDFLLLVCVYLFLMPLHVMEKKKIKNGLILCGAWCVMLAARLLIPAIGEHLIAEFFMRFVITMIAVGLISKKISWEMIYCTVWPLIVYHCINIIWNSLHRVSAIEQQPRVLQYLFSLLFFAAMYLLLSITLFRWLPRNGFYQAGPRRTLSAAAVLFLSLFSYYNFYQNRGESNLAVLVQLYCVTFLYLQAELFKKSVVKQEYALMERMWYQQKKQYEIAKDQMQVIDRKCHDLKYQVAAMRHIENPAEREKNLKELEQSIRIYDSIVKTGNEILDTLLSEKSLICEARDITIHCVIDGKKLFFMDSIDIYALFGNAIDNAIECVEKFSEKEMRFIDICVAEKQHFLYIRFSNPIERAPEYEDDLPKTTKKNKQYHGIGLKSIRHIAEKYGGDISVSTEMNCFNLEVLLPVK